MTGQSRGRLRYNRHMGSPVVLHNGISVCLLLHRPLLVVHHTSSTYLCRWRLLLLAAPPALQLLCWTASRLPGHPAATADLPPQPLLR